MTSEENKGQQFGGQGPRKIPISKAARDEMMQAHYAGRRAGEMYDHAQRTPVDLAHPADLKAHLITAHDWDDNDMWRNSHRDVDHILGPNHGSDDYEMSHREIRAIHDRYDHVHYGSDFPHSTTVGDSHFHDA